MRRLALSLIAVLAGCGPRTNATTDEPTTPTDAGADSSADAVVPTAEDTPSRPAGVGHTANIDGVALSADSTTALTRDRLGSLRLWPALDGSAEPQVVPVRAADQYAVGRAGESFTVFVTTGAGSAKLLRMGADGAVEPLGSLPPTRPVREGHVLPGGQHVIVLYRDRTIALVGIDGTEVASFEERRFRPDRLALADDGRTVVAFINHSAANKSKVELVRLGIDIDGKAIRREGSPRLVTSRVALATHNAGLSPDGKSFAYLDRVENSKFHVGVVDLTSEAPVERYQVPMRSQGGVGVGFVDGRHILVSPGDGSLSTLIDIDDRSTHARPGPPNDFNHQGRAQQIRHARQVFGYGSWLYVHDVDDSQHRFLGYDTMSAQSVAISPESTHVAWAFNLQNILVEPLGSESGGPVEFKLEGMNPTPWRIRFIDRDQLLVVDTVGNIVIYRWREGRVVARNGLIGSMRDLDYDASSRRLAIDRHHNDLRLFRVDDGAIEGPWILADNSTRFGLLRAETPGDPILWTLDGSSKLRRYTQAQLDAGLTLEQLADLGEPLQLGQPAPMAFDRQGRQYGVRWSGSTFEVFVDVGDRLKTAPATDQSVAQMEISPDADRLALVTNRSGSTVEVRDAKSLEVKWTFGGAGFMTDLSWSADGESLGLSTQTGAVVLDGDTGEQTARRCGLGFRVSQAPPSTAFSSINQRAVCES